MLVGTQITPLDVHDFYQMFANSLLRKLRSCCEKYYFFAVGISSVRVDSHIYFCTQCVIMTLGAVGKGGGGVGGGGANDVLKFRKIIDF